MPFQAFVEQDARQSRPSRWLAALVSIPLHLGALAAVAVHSFWFVEEVSPRGIGVTFLSVGTPPVPLQHPVRRAPPTPKPALPRIARVKPDLVQPREPDPDPRTVAEVSDDGELKGVAGRAEVPATRPTPALEVAPEPQIVDLTPVMLAPGTGISQRISDLSDPRFRPTLPPALNHPGTIVRGMFEVCVSVAGQVNAVKILRSADPLVDGDWTTVIRRWQYRPFTLKGRPTPFCHPLMLEVQSLRG